MKKILRPIAFVLSGMMMLSSVPVNAAYESKEEIAINLRAMSGDAGVNIPQDNPNLVYISPEAAASGATLHFGIYFETEKAELTNLAMRLEPDCEAITFISDTFVNPKSYVSDTPLDYTLPDGTPFSTRMTPYCFGSINSMGVYSSEAFSLDCNFQSSENALIVTWMHGIGNIESFLGGASDQYSFIEFDVSVAPGIQPGTHSISFIADETVSTTQSPTYVSTDISNGGPSKYADIIPTLKNVQIIVEAAQTEVTHPAFRFAEDTEAFSVLDYSGTPEFFLDDGSPVSAEQLTLATSGSPADLQVTTPKKVQIPLLYEGAEVLTSDGTPAAVEYWIGRKGDADRDGKVNSSDASTILIYAAENGAGGAQLTDGTEEEEAFALFLADVDGSGALDSGDAAYVLIYAAIVGAGDDPDWNAVFTGN